MALELLLIGPLFTDDMYLPSKNHQRGQERTTPVTDTSQGPGLLGRFSNGIAFHLNCGVCQYLLDHNPSSAKGA